MEKFRVNLDRPEPDRAKIQAKKDFNSFHATNFPKATLFQSKWFWGVSGFATVAVVVTMSLSSFSNNKQGQNVVAQTEVSPEIETLSSVPTGDLFVSESTPVLEVEETSMEEVFAVKEKEVIDQKDKVIKINNEKEIVHVQIEEKVSENELFELDFDPLDFPNLEVGNNLFSIDKREGISGDVLFSEEWDGVELEKSVNGLNLVLTKNGRTHSYLVKQYKK